MVLWVPKWRSPHRLGATDVSAATTSTIVLDDGEFYVELNCNYSAAVAPGFLQRRCPAGVTTPGGFECVGGFDRDSNGLWCASIDAAYDATNDSDSKELGSYPERLDAIATLWARRHDAYCRHRGG